MALSDTIFILRAPGMVPEIKRCVAGDEVVFLKELLEARPGEFVTVLTWNDGQPDTEDGPLQLEIWNGRYRHLARRHRASTKAAFAAATVTEPRR